MKVNPIVFITENTEQQSFVSIEYNDNNNKHLGLVVLSTNFMSDLLILNTLFYKNGSIANHRYIVQIQLGSKF